ncbi:hypothetical protein Tco_1032133 [Tanacetum coccineum]|uniref:Reverse transcriptase n=1 Tax=Tanacetum coccineum TaxID=301880 RepID=A0ABQ5GDB5_9ASTR
MAQRGDALHQRSQANWLIYGDQNSRARDLSDVLESVEAVVFDCMNCSLEATVSDSKIYKAVKKLGALKAPGKDGFTGLFFQRYWHIVSNLVIKALLPLGKPAGRIPRNLLARVSQLHQPFSIPERLKPDNTV